MLLRRAFNTVGLSIAAFLASMPAALSQQPAVTPSLGALREGFRHPPAEARLRCYWWWLNGNTDKATITHDLEEMKAKGFGGALLVDANGANQAGNANVPAGPTFGSPAWRTLFTHALAEADRLGLEITLNITSGWNLGGPDVTPEQASKLLTYSRTSIAGGAQVQQKIPVPKSRNGYYRQIAVLAYPLEHGTSLAAQPSDQQGDRHTAEGEQPSQSRSGQTIRFRSAAAETGFSMPDASAMLNDGMSGESPQFADKAFRDTSPGAVKDISSQVADDGTLTWEAPPGSWEVLRIGYTDSGARVSTSSGSWQGLAIDYMSRDAFLQYWNGSVEPLLTAAKPYKSLRYLASDSWELGGTNWTPKFREQFQKLRGYDPVPWLPVVAGRIVGDRDQSTRFLTDLRRTVADLVSSEHYDVFAEMARAHGMGMQAESGGPHGAPIDALETFRHSAVPQTEFWSQNAHRNTDPERFFAKQGASAANIYGQHFVAMEGETSIGPQWSESLATDLKPSFDMAITEGMNRMVWHEFTSSPASTGLPGQEYFAGTHLNPKITWWNAGSAFFDYQNRAQFLMQQGTPVDDALYFYGDNVPNFVRLKADDPAHVLPGYDYDVTNEDALLHTIRIAGTDLVGPSGVRWHLLALPRTRRVSLAVLDLVERYVRGGGTVVGLAPTSVTGQIDMAMQGRFDAMVKAIWAGCHPKEAHAYGLGRVICSDDAHNALVSMKIEPDVTFSASAGPPFASSASGLDYVHRRLKDLDFYFVRNAGAAPVSVAATFRVDARGAELWDGVTGQMLAVSTQDGPSGRKVMLSLPPFGSTFVVFGNSLAESAALTSAPTLAQPLTPAAGWSLSFQPDRGAPISPVHLQTLTSWSGFEDASVRYFSGTATYSAEVTAPKGRAIYLHFTEVREIAVVRVNGKSAGTVWAMPYTLRVDQFLHPGVNRLEIETTNLWPNRIIGDAQPGVKKTYTKTNITAYKADSPLLPSGLIGPVEWEIAP